ncbi:hypothetical protein AAEO57_02025 [Flavobacterium sp. DGU38]|uniref:Beta-lactamase enzyme family protein n=2 Tax=Flavobacterium calami TaxID=3139144 RepID=A0ABU9IJC0_9FLAO
MKSNFKFKLKNYGQMFFVLFAIFVGCKRVEKTNDSQLAVEKKVEISSKEIQRILNTKVNLESNLVTDDVTFSLPDNYYFQTSTIDTKDLGEDAKIGKIDLKTKEGYDMVQLTNSLFTLTQLADEYVNVIKDDRPNLLTIEDLKKDRDIDTVYYENKNSIVFSEGKTFTTLHFQYDPKTGSYYIYNGEISWSKEISQEDKLDLAFYFLRNAKNLLSTNLTKQEFEWKDYVENRPKFEINMMKYFFKNFNKEINTFLSVGESSAPAYNGYSFIKLHRITPGKEGLFYDYLNKLAEGKFREAYEEGWAKDLFYSEKQLKITPKGNASVVEITDLYEGKVYSREFMVFTIFNQNHKSFILKTDNRLNEKVVDFYAKMFNYYSENNTLELSK